MDEFAEINVTPFTDVLLVLLVVFMLMAAVVAPAGFERSFPCNCNVVVDSPRPYQADLAIARNGSMTLEGRSVDRAPMYRVMRTLRSRHPRMTLVIDEDMKAAYAYAIRAMDAAKDAGINDVSFMVR